MRTLVLALCALAAACGGGSSDTCDPSCPGGQVCSAGTCAPTCTPGYTECGSGAAAYCALASDDVNNCGACGNVCPGGERCSAGHCVTDCPDGAMVCGSSCVDTSNDPAHCGGCDTSCAFGEACVAGECTCGVTQLSLGRLQSCGLRDDGTVVCSGAFDSSCGNGELPDGTSGCYNITAGPVMPRAVPELGTSTQIEIGDSYGCALHADGTVWCMGSDISGILGDGDGIPKTTGVEVKTAVDPVTYLTGATQIAAGGRVTCAIANAQAYCWGENDHGELGVGASSPPVLIASAVDQSGGLVPASISAGWDFACAIDTTQHVWCWGQNGDAQSGQIGGGDILTPTQVSGLDTVVALSSAEAFSCAVKSNGEVWCWGRNSYGNVGVSPQTANSSVPNQLMADATTAFSGAVDVSVGTDEACARKGDGSVWCWGRNKHGQLGNGTDDPHDQNPTIYPVQVMTDASTALVASAIAVGHGHACAIVGPEQHPYCWGNNNKQQAGIGFGESTFAVPFLGCGR